RRPRTRRLGGSSRSSKFLGFPSDGGHDRPPRPDALQLAKSGNNMTDQAFQRFLKALLPACMDAPHAAAPSARRAIRERMAAVPFSRASGVGQSRANTSF